MAEEAVAQIEEGQDIGVFLTPAALVMLSFAFFVDVSEFLVEFIPVAGQIISIAIDIIAVIFIGLWTYFRSGTMQVTGKAAGRMTKAAKWAKRMKWLRPLCIVLEMIPVVGSLPLWILVVYLELKSSQG